MTAIASPIYMVVDGIPAVLPELSVELPDGRTGWFQQGNDPENGCFRAAVATYTQVPFDEVGPVSSLRQLEEWAGARAGGSSCISRRRSPSRCGRTLAR